MKRTMIALVVAALALTLPTSATAQEKQHEKKTEKHAVAKSKQATSAQAKAQHAKAKKTEHSTAAKAKPKSKSGSSVRTVGSESRGGSPAFCRSGSGHPVYGRQWCVDKGFGLGNSTWTRAGWENVVFGRNTRRGTVTRAGLGDILGSIVLGRLDTRARVLGLRDPLTGTWLVSDARNVLLVSAGGTPIAELTDLNRDGRVDVVLLSSR